MVHQMITNGCSKGNIQLNFSQYFVFSVSLLDLVYTTVFEYESPKTVHIADLQSLTLWKKVALYSLDPLCPVSRTYAFMLF